jgi:NAD(P)-dependent dehydrogenase (short-subunit alcohol dehydrogenase family)
MAELPSDLHGRTCLVSGASTGIGLATAVALARRGARLWLVSRDPVRGNEALEKVTAASRGEDARLILQDLSCHEGVRAAAREFLDSGEPLHILVNNAGAVFFDRRETADGLEATFALNHLAPFHLTLLLLERIVASAPARIITVSSAGHTQGRIRFDDLGATRSYHGFVQYCNTKLGNLLFSYALARRLEGTGVVAHALHPGVFRSRLGMDNRGLLRSLWKWVHPIMSSPERAAETTIYLASAPEVQDVNGGYWSRCRPRKSSRRSRDREVGERLWRVSEELAGLVPSLPPEPK